MKRVLLVLFASLLLTGCGVGSYSVSSGKADEAELSFTSNWKEDLTVVVDNNTFNVQSVRQKDFKAERKLRKTVNNTIKITPGQHDLKVYMKGMEVYSKKIFVSAQEHKIIEL